jgi:LysM repeat protein
MHLACGDAPASAPAPAPVPAPAPAPEVQHTVQKGETLWYIARAYGVRTAQILSDNQLTPRDVRRLREGATLRIVGATKVIDVTATRPREVPLDELPVLTDGAYHRIEDSESLWTVARQYDVPVEALLERNEMDDADVALLRVGQILIVPGITQAQVAKATREKLGPAKPAKGIGISHELARGETIWDVAHAYQVGVSELMAANSLNVDQVKLLRDGTRLFVPGVHQDKGGRVRRPTSAREARAAVVAKRLGLGTVTAAGQLLHGRIDPRWIRAAGGAERLEGHLRWPLANGWFVRGFASGEGGYHLAMDIAGEIGWNVRAEHDRMYRVTPAGLFKLAAGQMDRLPGWFNLPEISRRENVTSVFRSRRHESLSTRRRPGDQCRPAAQTECVAAGGFVVPDRHARGQSSPDLPHGALETIDHDGAIRCRQPVRFRIDSAAALLPVVHEERAAEGIGGQPDRLTSLQRRGIHAVDIGIRVRAAETDRGNAVPVVGILNDFGWPERVFVNYGSRHAGFEVMVVKAPAPAEQHSRPVAVHHERQHRRRQALHLAGFNMDKQRVLKGLGGFLIHVAADDGQRSAVRRPGDPIKEVIARDPGGG